MSDDLVTVRIGKGAAMEMGFCGQLRDHLTDLGIDIKTMSCREDGPDLVYLSLPIKKGNGLTIDNASWEE